MDEGQDRARQAGTPERVLRATARAVMPAPERVPELRELPHRQLVPTHSPAPAHPHQTLRERAKQNENVRLVELLEGDERSLRRIIDGLDALEADNAQQSAPASIVELASRRNAKRPGKRS